MCELQPGVLNSPASYLNFVPRMQNTARATAADSGPHRTDLSPILEEAHAVEARCVGFRLKRPAQSFKAVICAKLTMGQDERTHS